MNWCEPRDLRDWFNRSFSLRSLTFILIILLLAVFEFRFDWMEKALGSYLSTTNRQRPKTGVIWETAYDTEQAQDYLNEITVDQEAMESNARSAVDLADIVSLIADNQSVTISPEHFCSLYMKLPTGLKYRIMTPTELLQLQAENRWERTYIEKSGNQINIYPIDRYSRVLREIVISENTLVQIERGREIPFEGSLEEWGANPEQIYPADSFFSAFYYLPMDAQTEILAQPEQVLKASGRLVRVGFHPPVQDMWVDIGFELVDRDRRKVVALPAREWALTRLLSILEDKQTEFVPMAPDSEEQVAP